jgi:hypothetical protein
LDGTTKKQERNTPKNRDAKKVAMAERDSLKIANAVLWNERG